MKIKEEKGFVKGRTLTAGTIIAVMIIGVMLVCIMFMFLNSNGIVQKKSRVSDKEIRKARAFSNGENEENSGQSVEVIGVDEDIVITASGVTTREGGVEDEESVEYILANSDKEYLTDADVSGLSKEELRIARNEIMARHGRKFDSADLQEYFGSKSWYNATVSSDEFDANMGNYLSEVEKANIEMIKKYE